MDLEETIKTYEGAQGFLDAVLTQHVLIDSYNKLKKKDPAEKYPFVKPSRLKPGYIKGDIISEDAAGFHNGCLIFLTEEQIPNKLKLEFRFRDENRLLKTILDKESPALFDENFVDNFTKEKGLLGKHFTETLHNLKNTDLALLVTQDEKIHQRYGITHYRVNVMKNYLRSVSELATELGYFNGSFSANGSFDEALEKNFTHKFCQYHGFGYIIGGKRTAAANGSHTLRYNDINFTTYVGSKESRALTKITNDYVEKYVLMKLSDEYLKEKNEEDENFRDSFLIDDSNVGIFRISYKRNIYSTKPEENGIREFEPRRNWINKDKEQLIPLKEGPEPIPYFIVDSKET